MTITTERAEELAQRFETFGAYKSAIDVRALVNERDELKASAIDFEVKRDVSVQTLENVKAKRNCVQKSLAAQCAETKQLRQQLAAAQAVIAKKDEALKVAVVCKECLLRWRERHFLGSDQKSVVDREFGIIDSSLTIPSDDTALREMLAEQWDKAAKVCDGVAAKRWENDLGLEADDCAVLIRAEAEKLRKPA